MFCLIRYRKSPQFGNIMTVLRIVTNVASEKTSDAASFYRDLLELEPIMDLGWIVTYSSSETMATQINIATEGGSGTPLPDISIEVDNVDAVYERAKLSKLEIVYDLTNEPWGVRRFYTRDPFGKLVNILQHVEI